MKNYLRILVCGVALICNALPALANWDLAPATSGTVVHILSVNSGNGGTSSCAASLVECPTNIPVNTAGSPLFVSATPGVVTGSGSAGSAAAGVLTIQGIASMTKLLVTPDSVALPNNQSVNTSQINGVTPLMGNGVTGTGSQRVTIASDNTAFSVNAAPNTSAVWGLGAFGSGMVANGQAVCLYDGTNCIRAKGDETNGLWVNIKAGAGSGGTALGDNAAFTAGTTGGTPMSCLYNTGTANLTNTNAGVVRCTQDRQMQVSDSALLAAATSSIPAGTNVIGGVQLTSLTRSARNFPGCTVGTSSGSCLAANTAVVYLEVQNASVSSNVACKPGGTAILNDSGSFQLAPGQAKSWGPNSGGVPTGAINCISSNAAQPLYVEWN